MGMLMNNKNTPKEYQAFSLIELMVVIAIVAILAAVAIPSYKAYLIKSRSGSLTTAIDSLIQRSFEYASTSGHYANAYDLGLATNNTAFVGAHVLNPTAINPYLHSNLLIYDYGEDPGAGGGPEQGCGQLGFVQGAVASAGLGLDNADTYISFTCYLIYYNNTNQAKCIYVAQSGGGAASIPGDLIPGWINYFGDTAYTNNPENDAFMTGPYAEARCQ
jgi:prepilin-type N-terminal cleavage/methylation domain-containing protein